MVNLIWFDTYSQLESVAMFNKMDIVREVTCSAPVNIAVIKYWGKRNESLILPINSSLSVTLSQDDLQTTTTVRASELLKGDSIYLNGRAEDVMTARLQNVIQAARTLRRHLEIKLGLQVISNWGIAIASSNNFPTAAGLASSASGFACLTFALSKLYELPTSTSDLSRIARLGSGSACRSMFGGFVEWKMGAEDDGMDSFAVQIANEESWPEMRALILIVSHARKDVSSSAGMQESVKSSSLLKHRIDVVVPERMLKMKIAIIEKDFDAFAELTMSESNQFHAVCLDTVPPIFYLNDISKAIIQTVTKYNSLSLKTVNGKMTGYKACYTFDAGPNAVLYLLEKDIPGFLGLLNYVFPNTHEHEKYYGKASQYVGIDPGLIVEMTSLPVIQPRPVNCLDRIIYTKIGTGPHLLSDKFDSSISHLTLENTAKS